MKYIKLITSIAEKNGWKTEIDKYSKNKYEIKLSKPLKQMNNLFSSFQGLKEVKYYMLVI